MKFPRIEWLLSLVFLASACNSSHQAGKESRMLRRGLSGEPATLDPGAAADSFTSGVLLDLYEGLTAEAADGAVIPAVAESWSVDQSGTQYTFKIRKSAQWSNGIPIRAQDFVATWRRDMNPDFASPAVENLRFIAHAAAIIAGKEPASALAVSAPQDDLLMVTLERPTAFFPQILTHPSTFAVYDATAPHSRDPAKWVSNGPYVLSNWQPTTSIDLQANPHYWAQGNVNIKRVRYRFLTDDSAQYAAYRSGDLDMTDTVPANAIPAIRRERPDELVISPFLGTVYYGFNLTGKTLASVELRQALAMAIDRKRLVSSLGFGQGGAYGLVPPGTANYSPQNWDWSSLPDDRRIEEARRHYAKAGHSTTSPLRIRVLLNENEVIRRTAVVIGAMWKEVLGVETEIDSEEYRVFLQTRFDKTRWDTARLAWAADFNDASNFLEMMRTGSANNDMAYSNHDVDALLDLAANATESSQRKSLLEKSEALMLTDYPIVPLYFFMSKRLVKPYLHGVAPNPMNHLPSKLLSISEEP